MNVWNNWPTYLVPIIQLIRSSAKICRNFFLVIGSKNKKGVCKIFEELADVSWNSNRSMTSLTITDVIV